MKALEQVCISMRLAVSFSVILLQLLHLKHIQANECYFSKVNLLGWTVDKASAKFTTGVTEVDCWLLCYNDNSLSYLHARNYTCPKHVYYDMDERNCFCELQERQLILTTKSKSLVSPFHFHTLTNNRKATEMFVHSAALPGVWMLKAGRQWFGFPSPSLPIIHLNKSGNCVCASFQ